MPGDKVCSVCGGDLGSFAWGSGTVWQCAEHGVREWYFEHDPKDRWGADLGLAALRPRDEDARLGDRARIGNAPGRFR